MKKILSFTLVLAMILGSVSFCFATEAPEFNAVASGAAAFTDVTPADKCYAAVNLLKAIGAVDGTSNGRFEPTAVLTRAQIVAFVVKALGYPVTEGNAYVTKFADVPATAWYAGYVYWGSNLGIVDGRTATKFDPNAKVTADEATAFILRTLGYDDTVMGGYPAGYILAANGYGFYKVISAGAATVTRGDTARLFAIIVGEKFGSIATKETVASYPSYKIGQFILGTKTILEDSKVKTYENFVTQELIDSDKVNTYNLTDKETGKACDAPAKVYTTLDLSAYLGAYADIYVNEDNKVIGINPLTQFVSGVTKTGTYANTEWSIGGIAVDNTADDITFDGTKKASSLSFMATKFVNEKEDITTTCALSDGNTTTVYSVKTNATTGKITKVYAQQTWDGKNDVVAKNYGYVAPVFDANAKTYTVSAKICDAPLPMLKDGTGVDFAHVTLVGVDKFEDIKEDDVVTVYAYDESYVNKVEVSSTKVTGVLTEATAPSTPSSGTMTVYIDGTKYTALANKSNEVGAAVGSKPIAPSTDTNTYYVNYAGKVVGAKDYSTATAQFAVVLEKYAGHNEKPGYLSTGKYAKENSGLRLFTQDGVEKKVYTTTTAAIDTAYTTVEVGNVITYTLNPLGQIERFEVIKKNTFAGKEVRGNGIVVGSSNEILGSFDSEAVIFTFTNPSTLVVDVDPKTVAANYSVLSYKDVIGKTLGANTVVELVDDKTAYVAFVDLDVTTTEDPYIFTAKTTVVGGTKYTALNLVDGKTYTFTSTATYDLKTKMYKLTVANGLMTATERTVATTATAINLTYDEGSSLHVVDDVLYMSTPVYGVDKTTAAMLLDEDVAVATCTIASATSKTWAAKTVADLEGLAANYDYQEVCVQGFDLDETPDGKVDLVVVTYTLRNPSTGLAYTVSNPT